MNTTRPDVQPAPTCNPPRRATRLRIRGGSIFLHSAGLAVLVAFAAPALYAVPLRPDPTGGDGGNSSSGASNAAASPGPIQSWVGSVGDVATATGNKYTEIPIVSWVARGGLPVGFSLIHASESGLNITALSPKWSTSYSSSLAIWTNNSGQPCVTVYWGDQSAYTFINAGSGFAPPAGIHDKLTANGGSYDLVTKDQVKYHFIPNAAYPGGTYFFLSSVSDENGNTISINRNASTGLLTSIVDPTNRTITLGYTNGKLSSVTDPQNRASTINYDGSGRIYQIHRPAISGVDAYIQLGYDGSNDVNAQSDFKGQWSYFSYNADGSVATETDRSGSQTGFAYGIDRNGNANASAVTITDPNSHKSQHTYAGGHLANTIDAQGNVEQYWFDAANNLDHKQDRRGNIWYYTSDGNGNTLSEQDPPTAENSNGNTTHWTYNGRNRAVTKVLPSGRSVVNTYDGSDNLTTVQQKDAAGNVLASTTYTVSAGTYGLVTDKYDANNHHTHYDYDGNGCLQAITTPLGHKTTWYRTTLGTAYQRIDAMSRTTTYTVDAWERITANNYPDNTSWTYSFDANSNLTGFSNYTGSTTRSYDADDRLTGEYEYGSTMLQHSYDAAGKKGLLSTTTVADTGTITYGYTARNEVASVTDRVGSAGYSYDANGNLTNVALPNSSAIATTVDSANRVTGILDTVTWGGAWQYLYNYSTDGQKTQERDMASGSTEAFGYDALGHLTSDVKTGSNSNYSTYSQNFNDSYAYDGIGNRTHRIDPYGNSGMAFDADDELSSVSGYGTFAYNANGEQTSCTLSGQTSTFVYDFDGNMTSITKGGNTTTFQYDPLGRQVYRTAGGVTTFSAYDGEQLVREWQSGPGTVASYAWGPGGLIHHTTSGGNEFPFSDDRGNDRVISDNSQNQTAFLNPEGYGIERGTGGGTSSPFQWGAASGYRSSGDGPAGSDPYVKVGARYYDPVNARFITRDTDLSQSPYAYCDGDPVNYADPSGHSKLSDLLKKIKDWATNNGSGYNFNTTKQDRNDIGKAWEITGNVEIGAAGFGTLGNAKLNPNWKSGSSVVGAASKEAGIVIFVVAAGGLITRTMGQVTQSYNK